MTQNEEPVTSTLDIQQRRRHLCQRLAPLYEPEERASIARQVLEEVTSKKYPELFISQYKLTKKEEDKLENIMSRLEEGEPLQYIIGEVLFGDLVLSVAPGVLIPRPETEEMCALMLERGLLSTHGRAIDIGTGSGAIALYIAKHSTEMMIESIDISASALYIATSNAQRNKLSDRITFRQMDILDRDFTPSSSSYDLIVSNPPYVLERERKTMSRHVLEHEPASALFVPDHAPLLFYRRILHHLLPALSEGGWVVFELNASTAESCAELCRAEGLATELLKDMEGKQRFIFAQKRVQK